MPYSAGTAYLTVVPSFLNIQRAFEKEAKNLGEEVEKSISESLPEGIKKGMKEAAKTAKKEGAEAGDTYGGAFGEALKKHLATAGKTFKPIEIDVDTSKADRKIAQLNADLATMRDAKIGVEVEDKDFFAEIARLRAVADDLTHTGITVEIRHNAKAVRDELDKVLKIQQDVSDLSLRGAKDGDAYGGAFGLAAARRIKAAEAAIGEFDLDLNTRGADAALVQIAQRIKRLSGLEIDVDIPASEYMGELAALEAAIEAAEANEINIRVQTNLRQALAEIKALREFATRPETKGDDDGREYGGAFAKAFRDTVRAGLASLPEIELNANSDDVQREVAQIRAELTRLSSAEIGIDIDAGAALATLNAMEARLRQLAAQDVDIEVHADLLSAATQLSALQAMVNRLDGQEIDINVDVDSGIARLQMLAQTAGVSMSRLGMMVSLGASIGTAIVPAAAAAAAGISAIATAAAAAGLGIGVLALGLFGVVKAVSALNKFQQDSKKSAVSMAGANDRVANALDGVRSATRSLTRAERERIQAIEDLSRAQEEARRQLEDMALASRSNALAQRQAVLDAAEAKRELDAVMANPRATQEEREQALITFEMRTLQLDELAVQQKRLAADKAKADKAGVAGSDRVLAAQERIADATENVVAAQEQLVASQRALAAAYDKTGVAGGEALSNLQEAMDALSPAGQRFALFIFGLKDQFKGLQAAAEGGLLPGLETGIRNLLPLMPGLTDLVGRVATALGEIFVEFTESMNDPVWRRFFGYLGDSAVPTLKGMATFSLNVAKGIAAILFGLSGFNAPIGEGLLKWSEGFATWAETLETNTGWQKFLAYVREAAPTVLDFLGNLWDFTKKFVEAAAPIGLVVVKAFSLLFEWLAKLDTGTWTIIIAAIAGIGAALLVVSAITAAIGTGITGAIIAGIALVAAGLVLLYNKVEPVRAVVDATVTAMGKAWTFLWESVLKPTFEFIGDGINLMKSRWRDLYDDIFVHVFSAIGTVLSAWWETMKTIFNAVKPLFDAFAAVAQVAFGIFKIAAEIAGAVFNWLWDHVLRPVFGFIGVAFEVFSAIAQVAFGVFQIGVKIISAIFWWFYDKAIKPVLDLLKPVFAYIADVIEKHVAPPFKKGLENLGKAWDLFVQAAKVPVRFLIETILNDGILAGYNKIAKFFKVKPDDVRVDLPKGFARGGEVWGAGTATSDSIPALLSRGEHVWTAKEVEAAGGHSMIYRLRHAVMNGALPAFAGGGPVGDFFSSLVKKASDVFSGITDFFSNPVEALKRLAEKLFDLIPGKDTEPVKIALGMPKAAVNFAIDKVKGFFAATSGGPGGAAPGFLPWPAGPFAQRGDSGVWRNILQLVQQAGLPYRFGNSYRHGDPLWHGSGRAIDFTGYNQDALAQFFMNMQPRVLELIHTTSKGGYYISRGQRRNSMGSQDALHRDHLHIAMDSGGMLQPGWNPPIWNGTGRPEPVLTGQQWDSIAALTQGGDGGRQYHFQFRDTTLDPGKLRAMQDREDALSRQGRAR